MVTRAIELVAGFAFWLAASVAAAQFFLVHHRFESSVWMPYLIALGAAEMFLFGLSRELSFFGLSPRPTEVLL